MATAISGAFLDLGANSAAFAQDMGKASKALRSSGARMNKSLAKMNSGWRRLSMGMARAAKSALSFRGITAMLVGGAGIGLLVKKSLDAADAIGKTADSIGITTDQLQEYRHVAALSGVTTQNLDGAFQAFGKRLGELRAGTGTMVTFLDKFDKTLKNNLVSAGDTGKALDLMFDAIAGVANASDRAALSAAAFGRSAGVSMTRFVKDGTQELANMRIEARRLGLVLDESLIRNAEITNDRLSTLARILKTQTFGAILENADAIGQLAQKFIGFIPEVIKATRRFAEFLGIIDESKLAAAADRIEEIRYLMWEIRTGNLPGKLADALELEGGKTEALLNLQVKLNAALAKQSQLKGAKRPTAASAIPSAGGRPSPLGSADPFVKQVEAAIADYDRLQIAMAITEANRRDAIDASTFALTVQSMQTRDLISATYEGAAAVQARRMEIQLENDANRLGIDITTERGQAWSAAATEAQRMTEGLKQAEEGARQYKEMLTTVGDTVGRAVTDVLLYGATWGDVAKQIGVQIIDKIISSLISAGVQMAINFVIARTFGAAAVIAAMAEGTSVALAWAPAAAFVSLATLGANSVPAAAALASSTALAGGLALVPRATGGPVSPGTNFLVGERGPELFTPARSGTIIPNDRLSRAAGGDGGPVTVIFQITANDTRGFDELLQSRRGLITSMINGAMRDRGQRGIA